MNVSLYTIFPIVDESSAHLMTLKARCLFVAGLITESQKRAVEDCAAQRLRCTGQIEPAPAFSPSDNSLEPMRPALIPDHSGPGAEIPGVVWRALRPARRYPTGIARRRHCTEIITGWRQSDREVWLARCSIGDDIQFENANTYNRQAKPNSWMVVRSYIILISSQQERVGWFVFVNPKRAVNPQRNASPILSGL